MADKKDISFETALERLEEIVRALENGKEPLDGSLKLFEEGVKLVGICKEQLDTAEQRVKLLLANGTEDETDLNEN
jgi:exodeoxyribonuclease VII small subunit